MQLMQLRDDAVVARYDDVRLAFLQSALNAGQGKNCVVTVGAANTGHAAQGMAVGADRPHVAAMSVQSQRQSSRQRPPFRSHNQHGLLGFSQIKDSLNALPYSLPALNPTHLSQQGLLSTICDKPGAITSQYEKHYVILFATADGVRERRSESA